MAAEKACLESICRNIYREARRRVCENKSNSGFLSSILSLKKAAITGLLGAALFLGIPGDVSGSYCQDYSQKTPVISTRSAVTNSSARPEQETELFESLCAWLQLGNQIKYFDNTVLNKLSDTGISKVLLLNSAYAGENGYFDQLPVITQLCYSRGIRVSLGTLVFKDNWILPYLREHPDRHWINKSQGNYTSSPYEHCLCPGMPENQDFVIDKLVSEAKRCNADEIHIDYEVHSCYDSYCRTEFKKKYAVDPLKLSTYDPRWKKFRNDQATEFMRKLSKRMKKEAPEIKLSFTAPIVSNDNYTAYDTCINYSTIAPYCDEIIPMIYIGQKSPAYSVQRHLNKAKKLVLSTNPNCAVSAGIILVNERTKELKCSDRVEEEAKYALKAGSRNLVLFEYRYMEDTAMDLLRSLTKPLGKDSSTNQIHYNLYNSCNQNPCNQNSCNQNSCNQNPCKQNPYKQNISGLTRLVLIAGEGRSESESRAFAENIKFAETAIIESGIATREANTTQKANTTQIYQYNIYRDSNYTSDSINQLLMDLGSTSSNNTETIFVFSGHGTKQGTVIRQPDDELVWMQLLSNTNKIKGRKTIIIDSCYSGSAVEVFRKHRPKNTIVISTTQEDTSTYYSNGLLNYVLPSYFQEYFCNLREHEHKDPVLVFYKTNSMRTGNIVNAIPGFSAVGDCYASY